MQHPQATDNRTSFEQVFIWDFFGHQAEPTAKHFEKHLREFAVQNELEILDTIVWQERLLHCGLVAVCSQKVGIEIQLKLKPNRSCSAKDFEEVTGIKLNLPPVE
jgi:hypothetical protein